eukprot:g2508.t1
MQWRQAQNRSALLIQRGIRRRQAQAALPERRRQKVLRDWYAREDLDKEQGFPSKEEFTNSGYWAMASNIVIEKVWQKAKKNLEVAKAFQSMMKPNPRLKEPSAKAKNAGEEEGETHLRRRRRLQEEHGANEESVVAAAEVHTSPTTSEHGQSPSTEDGIENKKKSFTTWGASALQEQLVVADAVGDEPGRNRTRNATTIWWMEYSDDDDDDNDDDDAAAMALRLSNALNNRPKQPPSSLHHGEDHSLVAAAGRGRGARLVERSREQELEILMTPYIEEALRPSGSGDRTGNGSRAGNARPEGGATASAGTSASASALVVSPEQRRREWKQRLQRQRQHRLQQEAAAARQERERKQEAENEEAEESDGNDETIFVDDSDDESDLEDVEVSTTKGKGEGKGGIVRALSQGQQLEQLQQQRRNRSFQLGNQPITSRKRSEDGSVLAAAELLGTAGLEDEIMRRHRHSDGSIRIQSRRSDGTVGINPDAGAATNADKGADGHTWEESASKAVQLGFAGRGADGSAASAANADTVADDDDSDDSDGEIIDYESVLYHPGAIAEEQHGDNDKGESEGKGKGESEGKGEDKGMGARKQSFELRVSQDTEEQIKRRARRLSAQLGAVLSGSVGMEQVLAEEEEARWKESVRTRWEAEAAARVA